MYHRLAVLALITLPSSALANDTVAARNNVLRDAQQNQVARINSDRLVERSERVARRAIAGICYGCLPSNTSKVMLSVPPLPPSRGTDRPALAGDPRSF